MLACSYLHASTAVMDSPRRLCLFAVKKRIEAAQNVAHARSVRFAQPQYEGRATLPPRFDATEEWSR